MRCCLSEQLLPDSMVAIFTPQDVGVPKDVERDPVVARRRIMLVLHLVMLGDHVPTGIFFNAK